MRCVWEKGDHSGYVQVRFPKAYVVKWDISGKDNDEAAIPCDFLAKLDMSVPGANVADCPFVIEELATLP